MVDFTNNPTKSPEENPVSIVPTKRWKPVHVDGALYVIIAVASSILASLSTDEAAKLFDAIALFEIKTVCEASLAGAGALKMFRSTSYSDSKDEEKK